MAKHLPSITRLRAFEATARHLSVRRAAQELNLTPTAISHQITSLEALLGVPLFLRHHGPLRLTDPGRDYLQSVRSAITALSVATDRVMDASKDTVLTIACLSTFGLKCLIPSLPEFRAAYPDYSLRVRTVLSFDNILRHDFDVAIIYGAAPWKDIFAERLCAEEAMPVCSPLLLETGPLLKRPEHLQLHTVIRTESHILRDEWPAWLEKAKVPDLKFADEIIFNLLFPSVQAAIDGLGVFMGRVPIVAPDLAAGRLVAPFAIRLPSTSDWSVVAFQDPTANPRIRAFMDWAVRRFASSTGDPTCIPTTARFVHAKSNIAGTSSRRATRS